MEISISRSFFRLCQHLKPSGKVVICGNVLYITNIIIFVIVF